ncbi:MAG: HEPN domain-containing protein [Verrucomicrobia bacterium]|nr:HEPN domain-containing protein [Verrucomicrobiota bacterium]
MKPATREWVAKAEEDFLAALDLARRRKRPLWNGVCFHAQQCVEKYLKARMEEAGLPLQRTHDLDVLLNYLLPVEPLWSAFRPALQNLTDYAVDFRYPGQNANKTQARRALADCKLMRREARASLSLPV